VASFHEQIGRRDDPPVRGANKGGVVARTDQRGRGDGEVGGDPLDEAELTGLGDRDGALPSQMAARGASGPKILG